MGMEEKMGMEEPDAQKGRNSPYLPSPTMDRDPGIRSHKDSLSGQCGQELKSFLVIVRVFKKSVL